MNTYKVNQIIEEIMSNGQVKYPRGQKILELQYFQGLIESPWSTYPSRKYPMDYCKREMQWYLGANPYDHRICNHAKMWTKIMQIDSGIFSNYGYYWFGPQNGFQWVFDSPQNDADSRQADIAMNNYLHAFKDNKDFVCTKGIQFRLNGGYLDMHVAMRSSDAIYGLGTDLPCFTMLQNMVACELGVQVGHFIFSSDSIHVYSKHFEMAKRISTEQLEPVDMPAITDTEDLITGTFESPFGEWLMEAPL